MSEITLGKHLKDIRVQSGATLDDMASKSGLNKMTFWLTEKGEQICASCLFYYLEQSINLKRVDETLDYMSTLIRFTPFKDEIGNPTTTLSVNAFELFELSRMMESNDNPNMQSLKDDINIKCLQIMAPTKRSV